MSLQFDEIVCQTDREWLGHKRRFVGSSESPALFGLGYSNQSPYAMYVEKTTGKGVEFDAETLRVMELGKLAEPFARSVFEFSTGHKVYCDEGKVIRKSRRWPFMGATIDAWIEPNGEPEVVELKFIGIHQRWDFAQGAIPHKYMIQLQHQLACTGWKRGWLMALCANESFMFQVEPHDRIVEAVVNKCEWFMGCVQNRNPPPVDGTDATAKALMAQFPEPVPSEVVALDGEFDRIGKSLERIKQRRKRAEEAETMLSNRIRAAIGNAEIGYTPSGHAWKWGKRGRSRALISVSANRPEIRDHQVKGG